MNGELKKRQRVNLTIRKDVLEDARALGLNTSRAAEAGITQAIRTAREREWLEANREAIEAYNRRIEKDGLLLKPEWAPEE